MMLYRTILKICLFLIIFLGSLSCTQVANKETCYHPVESPVISIDALRNPDRGFHSENAMMIPRLENPWRPTPYNKDVYKNNIKSLQAEADSITLIQQYFYLTPYLTKDLDECAFEAMEKIFDQLKEDDIDVILRFAYNQDGLNCPAAETEERILGHIRQITPFLRKHIGQIAVMQAGFFGAWGEWHTSPLTGNQEAKNHIVSALLDALPAPYYVQIRYPAQARKLTLRDESKRGRFGYNNDYFTVGEHSHAPQNDYVGEDYSYVREKVKAYNPYIIGEIPYAEKTEWGLHELISTDKTLKTLNEHRYSAFDITQNRELNINHWKEVKLYPGILDSLNIRYDSRYFENEDGELVCRSFYQFVRDHLGYRINLKDGARIRRCGHNLKYDFTLTNSGFARPMYPGEAYLVLLKDNKICEKVLLTDNIREWLPMTEEDESVMAEYRYEGKVKMTGLKGNYKVGIWIPKTNELVRYRAVQNIKMAPNNNVEHLWIDGQYAINVIGELKF